MGLNPFQSEVEKLALSKGLRGSAQASIYQTPDFMNLVQRFFGAIPLPAGVTEQMVTQRTPGMLEYRDAEGYLTQLMRNLSGTDPRLGEVSVGSTNRPSVLPIERSNPILGNILGLGNQNQASGGGDFFGLPTTGVPAGSVTGQPQRSGSLLQQLNNLFSSPFAMADIDPKTLELLSARSMAENKMLDESFQRAQGTSIAQLVGQGVGSSSIAADIMGKLLQDQGLVRSNTLANQADRELGVRSFVTQGQAGRDQSMQQFVTELLGQALNRDVSGAQIDTSRMSLNQQDEQFFRTLIEQMRQFDEQMRFQERQSLINNIFKGIAAGTGIATGFAGGFGGGGIPAPPIPNSFPSSSVFGNFPTNPRLPTPTFRPPGGF